MTATATCGPPDAVQPSGDQSSWRLTSAVFRDDTGRHEFQMTVDGAGKVSVTLFGADVDAFGVGTAILVPVTMSAVTCAATIVLTGYDIDGDRFRHLEAAIGATWSLDRADRTKIEVSGTALVTDLDDHGLTGYRAVRRHPFNHLDGGVLDPGNASTLAGGSIQVRSLGPGGRSDAPAR